MTRCQVCDSADLTVFGHDWKCQTAGIIHNPATPRQPPEPCYCAETSSRNCPAHHEQTPITRTWQQRRAATVRETLKRAIR
jgi:hypothetical protein